MAHSYAHLFSLDLIREIFGVDAHIGTHPLTGRMHIAVAPLTNCP